LRQAFEASLEPQIAGLKKARDRFEQDAQDYWVRLRRHSTALAKYMPLG